MNIPKWLNQFYCRIGWHNISGYDFSEGIPGRGTCHWCGNTFTLNADGSFSKIKD